MDKKQTNIYIYIYIYISSSLIHRRICLVITATAGWMMVLETLSDVQLSLLHTEVDRVNLLLYSRNGLLHGTHTTLKCS